MNRSVLQLFTGQRFPPCVNRSIGTNEVTAIGTGRSIHQSAIQTAVPIAAAPLKPKLCCNKKITAIKAAGPVSNCNRCCFVMVFILLSHIINTCITK